jgi:hypothetical protein
MTKHPDGIPWRVCRLEGVDVVVKPEAPAIQDNKASIIVEWSWPEGDTLGVMKSVMELRKEDGGWRVTREYVMGY